MIPIPIPEKNGIITPLTRTLWIWRPPERPLRPAWRSGRTSAWPPPARGRRWPAAGR